MGREIRRVPANWEHPRQECHHSPWAGGCSDAKRNGGRCYQPLHDEDFETVAKKWIEELISWQNGTHEAFGENPEYRQEYPFFWQYGGDPPDDNYYRPKWTDAERTHFQVYETVSEGTPVTPAFATKEELVEYLVAHGTYWDEGRGWNGRTAEQFVEGGWAPSLIARVSGGQSTVKAPGEEGFYPAEQGRTP